MPTVTAEPQPIDSAAEHNVLQEYADNRGVALKVDREKGIIPGVKLLGTMSKKGREYPRAVMAKALPLYEGMRVNVDHVDPGQRRSLRDRIGLVKNVTLKEDGLYGDFHYNPKHALAEQIAWDAENAPQNLGFSHDTRGNSKNIGGRVVVESIDKVLSVDLVANPATTTGLFEDEAGSREPGAGSGESGAFALLPAPGSMLPAPGSLLPALHKINLAAMVEIHGHMNETDGKKTSPAQKRTRIMKSLAGWQDSLSALSSPADDSHPQESTDMDWKEIDLDGLKANRPELFTALQESSDRRSADVLSAEEGDELKSLQEELKTLKAEKAARQLQESIAGQLKAAGLDPENKIQCSEIFMEDLSATTDPARRKAKIDDRQAIIAAGAPTGGRPVIVPSTGSPLQESHDGPAIPPATAPLAERLARFTR